MIEDMKKTTKIQREIRVGDIFDLSFVKPTKNSNQAAGNRDAALVSHVAEGFPVHSFEAPRADREIFLNRN